MQKKLVFLSLWLLMVVSSFVRLSETRFYQYHTKYSTNNEDHTCFYLSFNGFHGRANYLVPYCLRMSDISEIETHTLCYGKNVTFAELKQNNITADQLMKWFPPIDLVSDYQYFLASGFGENGIFCNCSDTNDFFGARCQYQFAMNTSSFYTLVAATFAGKDMKRDIRGLTEENDVTCHLLWNCTTYSGFCIDWRQVCDSRRDCTNGRDEEWCLEKELNNCDEKTEYRCRSGHCIPRTFAFDLTPDCPDWDDEQNTLQPIFGSGCTTLMDPVCEEHACGNSRFSCGDGECVGSMY